jgi:hypothetical protein
VGSSLLALLLLEVGLRVFTPYPVTTESNRADDPLLGYVMDTDYPGVDERGFRNPPGALEMADLVFIGDSQTFGYNVDGEHSFPSVVATKTHRHVYNFGIGSYGIYQYHVLLEKAAELPVRDVVLVLYLANDLASPCRAIRTEYWQRKRRETGLVLPDCGNDPTAPVRDRITRTLRQTATVQVVNAVLGQDVFISPRTHWFFPDGLRVERERAWGHSGAASLEDPDIRVSFENGKAFLLEAQRRFAAASIGFLVLLLPSKEVVVHDWLVRGAVDVDEAFDAVVQNELNLTHTFEVFFDDNGIAYLDALPFLVDGLKVAIARGEPFYKPNDGHPLAWGYEVYADAAIAGLDRLRSAP